MGTVLSHIIQKRYSKEFENIATDALAYILEESDSAKLTMMKLLQEIIPTLPNLTFKTQLESEDARPDIWGLAEEKTWVFIENKFWAGLTENQPVTYLNELNKYEHPTLLLFIAPGLREQTMIRELSRKVKNAGFVINEKESKPNGIVWAVEVGPGKTLALTSWQRLLKLLEEGIIDEPGTLDNLDQLKSLCEVADNSSFKPFNGKHLSDQYIPALILQLGSIIRESYDQALTEEIVFVGRLGEGNTFGTFGKYLLLNNERGVGIFYGVDYSLWKQTGRSPLWIKYSNSTWGQGQKVALILEKLSRTNDIFITPYIDGKNGGIAVAVDILPSVDKDEVIEDLVRQLKQQAELMKDLKSK